MKQKCENCIHNAICTDWEIEWEWTQKKKLPPEGFMNRHGDCTHYKEAHGSDSFSVSARN